MKKENLLELKIDIQVDDDKDFFELAILLDKPEFLELLPQLRKEYEVEGLVKVDYFHKVVDGFFTEEIYKINFDKYQNHKQISKYMTDKTLALQDTKRLMDKFQLVDTEANLLCFIFGRPPYFSQAIEHAIFCGAVDDYSFRTTSVTVVEDNRVIQSVADFQLPQVAILVSPNSSDREIKEAGRIAKKWYKNDKRLSYYKPKVDMASKIRNYREWYWSYLSGEKTYDDIANDWADREDADLSGLDANRILKGISYYKKLLTQ